MARMKFIPAAVVHPRLVILHLRSLCYSQFTWAAGFARPSADELASVASDVKASFGRNLTFETPPCLLHEACGWLTEPSFCADWALLQQAHRLHCSPPSWLELLPLSEACAPWFRVLPLATKVLQRLGWTVSENGGVIYRRDNALRLREYRMGFDSLQVLKEWLLLHYRRSYLSRCGRVVKSLHRQGPNLAQGADLPAPAAGAFLFERLAMLQFGPKTHPCPSSGRPWLPVGQSGTSARASGQGLSGSLRNVCAV